MSMPSSGIGELARDTIAESLADFVAGVVIELVADLVFLVGGVGQEDPVAVDDQEIPARAMVLMLQKFAQRVGSLEQRRRAIG